MHITYSMVRDDIPLIIDTRGRDYVYEVPRGAGGTCQYMWDGAPSCLIGTYLVDLGLPPEAFAEVEGKGIDDIVLQGHLSDYGFTVEPEALLAMGKIQDLQDNSYSWGDAYDYTFED